MRSSLISRSLFLSTISVLAGCGDDNSSCGPAGASAAGLIAGNDQVTLTYGAMTGGLNHDCPDPAAPDGIDSLTIQGAQTDGSGIITFCVPRPDQLAMGKVALALDVPGSLDIHIIDVIGDANSCDFSFDRTLPPTGTAEASGLCGNGSSAAGFALIVDGALSLTRKCGTTMDKVSVTLRGKVAVAKQPN